MHEFRISWICLLAAVLAAAGADKVGAGSAEVKRARRQSRGLAELDAINAKNDPSSNNSCPDDHTHMLSPSTACCYQKLVTDPNCCVDQKSKDVKWRRIQRPGTHWACNTTDICYDTLEGDRGEDLMAIPHGASCSSPRILYIHGGSWMYGSPTTSGYPQLASRLAVATGAVIFTIDYPLVPYGNFSTILDASIQALQWLAKHGPEESCPPDTQVPLFVAGDSSGGGSALSLVLQLQAEPHLLPGQDLSGAFLFSPWTNLMCNTPEYYTNAFAKIQSPGTFKDLSQLQLFVGDIIFQAVTTINAADFSGNALEYVGYDESLQTDPIASPYFANSSHFSGKHMPPLHIAVGSSESILGDSVRMAYEAAKGGADVTVEIYNGMWHVFPMYSEGCGSGTELWAATHAIESAGTFVREITAEGKKARQPQPFKRDGERYPLLHYLYDPMVRRFAQVGELMPNTAANSWAAKKYDKVMKHIAHEPWWVVLPSIGGSAVAIFVVGILVGGLMDYGGREAYNRARKVAEYRRKCVEIPIGYVNLDAINLGGGTTSRLERSFLTDFVMGVPEDVQSTWRVETARAKQGEGTEAVDAARAENAAWRRMALPGYEPPEEVPKPEPPVETLDTGASAQDLIGEAEEGGLAESWAVATAEAKDGSIEAARRENLAWRMQNMKDLKAESSA